MPASWRICAAEPRAPGVGHHVDGAERLLPTVPLPCRSGFSFCQLGHHDLGDSVAGLAPDVHHLVVALAGGDQARDVLLLDLLTSFRRVR